MNIRHHSDSNVEKRSAESARPIPNWTSVITVTVTPLLSSHHHRCEFSTQNPVWYRQETQESNVHREDGEEVARKWLHRQNVIILCFYAVHRRGLVTPSTKKANRLARRCDPADDVQVRQDDDERCKLRRLTAAAAIFWNIERCDKARPPKRCTAELGSDLKIVCDATEPRVAPGHASVYGTSRQALVQLQTHLSE
ncbi:uncharacterized protein ARMOST_21018 [Armillaria ostoyae]|uniref:Uncharacterized protein n=1 Tax=Armillaria ostoyae TaxID=47428 RepID=A0A284S8Y3_ARMOS|nr:uncharacterized protein ARMOST_21018 [Armillaria ostoyae]